MCLCTEIKIVLKLQQWHNIKFDTFNLLDNDREKKNNVKIYKFVTQRESMN